MAAHDHTTTTAHPTTVTTRGVAHVDHGATPGTMDDAPQERTYEGFISILTWSVVVILLVLTFLALANS